MVEARIVNELDCSESVYWDRVFLDTDFTRQVFVDKLGFTDWRVIKRTEVGDEAVELEVEVVPPVADLPGPIRAVIGDGLSYREIGRFDKRRRRYAVKALSAKLGDRLIVEGELYTERVDDRRCRRIFAVKINAKIFGVGGVLEKRVLADMQNNYAASARFISEYAKLLQ